MMDYIKLDKTSKIPYYIQISDSIKTQIEQGNLKNGVQLPTESSISHIFNISIIVAKKAYEDLQGKGLITRVRGKGTFVHAQKPIVINLSKSSYAIVKYLAKTNRQIIYFNLINSHPIANHLLSLNNDDYIYEIKAISTFNEQTAIYQSVYLPAKFFPNLAMSDLQKHSFYELINERFKLKPQNLNQTYHAINLDTDEALLLDQKKDEPGYYIRSYITDSKNTILAYFFVFMAGSTVEFEVDIL